MPIKHIILAILVAAIWGCNFIFVKLGVMEVPPLFLCALRFLFASIPAVFFFKWPKASFKMVALYGLVMFALQFSLIFSSFDAGMTAGMASLVAQTQIFFSVFFAVLFLGERPALWQIVGALVAFMGILLVASHVDSNMTLPGFLLVIGAAATWGFGNLITKKLSHVNMISLVVWGSLISCLPLFVVSYLVEGPERITNSMHNFSWVAVVSLVYIVIASTWIGYGLWNWLLSRYSVTAVVPFTLLVPVFGILSSVVILGESFELWKIAASALVIVGLCINLIGPRFIARKKIRMNVSES